MLVTSTVLAIAAIAASTAMTYKSMQAQKAAARAQRNAQQTQMADQAAQRAQMIRDQYRQQRIKQAEIAQSAADTGAFLSSGQIGSESALGSTIANNVSSINRAGTTYNAVAGDYQTAANWMMRSNTYSAIGGLAGEAGGLFMSMPGTQNDMMKMFMPKSPRLPTNINGGSGSMWQGIPYAQPQG